MSTLQDLRKEYDAQMENWKAMKEPLLKPVRDKAKAELNRRYANGASYTQLCAEWNTKNVGTIKELMQ